MHDYLPKRLLLQFYWRFKRNQQEDDSPSSESHRTRCKICQSAPVEERITTFVALMVQVKELSKLKEGELKSLYDGSLALSNRYLDNIVEFNLLFSFTSFFTIGKLEKSICYKIKGMVYYKIGMLKPHRMLREGMIPTYLLHDKKED